MADIYGSHFEFGGTSSRQHGLIIANINVARITALGGSKEAVTVFNNTAKRRYLIDDSYTNSPLSFDVEIVEECGRAIDPTERRRIEKWLFNYQGYRRLYFDIADDATGETFEYVDGLLKRNYLNCRFINPEKLEYNNGVVGYKATLEADSNMFWQDAITKIYSLDSNSADSTATVCVDIDTDLNEYIYPKVTIRIGDSGGDVIICNNNDSDSRLTKFVGLSAYASIVMKGELNFVSDQYYEKLVGRNFIRLLDGENNFTIIGDVASIEFEYSVRRAL